jgi:hypothetical protein
MRKMRERVREIAAVRKTGAIVRTMLEGGCQYVGAEWFEVTARCFTYR